MQTKLTPIQHPLLTDHHRVPVAFIEGNYEVYVGDNLIRYYTPDELPDEIKSKLTMIRAATIEPLALPSSGNLLRDVYECRPDHPLYEIGWMVTPSLFVVVIPSKHLTYMKGEMYGANKMMFIALSYRRLAGGAYVASDRPTFPYLESFCDYTGK